MSELRPVNESYTPGYPHRLEEGRLRELLRPGLLARFSSGTLLAGALLAGVSLTGSAGAQEGKPAARGTRLDPEFGREVHDLVSDLLAEHGGDKGFWNKSASIRLSRLLEANPPVKYPSIPISYGNSHCGVFDVEGARKATRKLFAKYGIELREGVRVKGEGYEFKADGYDEATRTGFEIVMPIGSVGLGGQEFEAEPAADRIEEGEMAALGKDVAEGGRRIFVVEASGFANMDGDLFTPLEYYLASVVDYLDWIHGDRKIEKNRVLGSLPGGTGRRGRLSAATLPGCDFEEDADLDRWAIVKGKANRSEEWSAFGKSSLHLELEPGGEAVYAAPADATPEQPRSGASIYCRLYVETGDQRAVTITITLKGTGEDPWVVTKEVRSHGTHWIRRYDGGDLGPLEWVKISTNAKVPVSLFIDDIGVR